MLLWNWGYNASYNKAATTAAKAPKTEVDSTKLAAAKPLDSEEEEEEEAEAEAESVLEAEEEPEVEVDLALCSEETEEIFLEEDFLWPVLQTNLSP